MHDNKIATRAKKVLNVGGNSKSIAIPDHYDGWEHLMLDIDPKAQPDILCDARTLDSLEGAQFDAIYCSHNLEHYYHHEVPRVLNGFRHVLKADGFAEIKVPDMLAVMQTMLQRNLDIEDPLYVSPAGPISSLDIFYGFGAQIERSGEEFFAHKTGFTQKSLQLTLARHFAGVFTQAGNLEVRALAFKGTPNEEQQRIFRLPPASPAKIA
jgi:SAM-dependent methyltransferase